MNIHEQLKDPHHGSMLVKLLELPEGRVITFNAGQEHISVHWCEQ